MYVITLCFFNLSILWAFSNVIKIFLFNVFKTFLNGSIQFHFMDGPEFNHSSDCMFKLFWVFHEYKSRYIDQVYTKIYGHIVDDYLSVDS